MKTHADVDVELSRKVAAAVKAVDKDCFQNALAGLAGSELDQGVAYVEGYVVWGYFPHAMQHGWLELPDGRVVDPTPSYHERASRVSASWERTYHEANRFSKADVHRIFARLKRVSLPLGSWELPQRRLGNRAKASFEACMQAQASFYAPELLAFIRQGRSLEELRATAYERIDRVSGSKQL